MKLLLQPRMDHDRPRSGGCGDRVSLLICLVGGLGVALMQPLTPWWLHIDCDGTYLGSALNLYAGKPTEYFDHPGMPLQALLTFALALDHAVLRLSVNISRTEYVDRVLMDPGSVLWLIRGLAIGFFLLALAAAHEVGRRWSGRRMGGLVAVVLLLAAIGHMDRATMYRPGNVLSALSLVITFLAVSGVRRESVGPLVAAALLTGFAITVKVHAVGLLPPVLVAFWLTRRADWTGQVATIASTVWRMRLRLCLLLAVAWGFAVVWMNSFRPAPDLDARILAATLLVFVYAGLTLFVDRQRKSVGRNGGLDVTSDRDREPWGILIALHPMWAIGVLALGAGIVLPNLVLMDQLVPMLRSLFYALTGRGINAGFDPAELFSAFRDQWREPALLLQLPFPALALIGLVRCYRAGDRSAVVWSVAAVSMFVLAALRGVVHPSTHHYAPAMSLCIPLVLSAMTMQWSAAPSIGARRAIGGVLTLPWARVLPLIAALVLAVGPVATAMRSSRLNHARCEAIDSLARQLEPRLGAGEFIMTDYWAQNGDSGYFMLLRDFCRYTPERHFRALPDTPPALEYAATLGRRPAYYLTSGESRTKLERLSDGRLVASSIWGGRWYVRLVETHALANITISMYAVEGSVSADSSRGERVILVEGAGMR